jgi:heterodisulfide reductase subunit A
MAGVCQGPKDIPSTVAQASAAAARVLQNIMKGKVRKDIDSLSLMQIEENVKTLSSIKIACYERIY